MALAARTILAYTLMPQLMPRLRDLVSGGFGFIAYSIACVFQTAGLLPASHPYANPANIGKFGLRHVLAQAAVNLRFSARNIDQIILFVLVLLGTVLLAVQIGLFAFSLMAQVAQAAVPTTFSGFFVVDPANVKDDIAYMLLDRVFGIPGLFGSCVDANTACLGAPVSEGSLPFPYHTALHDLLGFYSKGLLCVAAVVLFYHVITMVAEMSESGNFFGRRFNRVWAPVRLVAAIGLLMPINSGLNSAQYITLYVAKYGSAMATNAWKGYAGDVVAPQTLAGAPQALIAKPQYPSANDLIQFLAIAQTCWWAYDDLYYTDIEAYAVREAGVGPGSNAMDLGDLTNTYDNLYDIQKWFGGGDIVIVFGEQDDDDPAYKKYKGNVRPYCGTLTLPATRMAALGAAPLTDSVTGGNPPKTYTFRHKDGIDELTYRFLIELLRQPWYDTGEDFGFFDLARKVVNHSVYNNFTEKLPTAAEMQDEVDAFNDIVKDIVDDAYKTMTTTPVTEDSWAHDAAAYGWGGAAIWYNKIAEYNGIFSQAVFDMPSVTDYPEVLQFILLAKEKTQSQYTTDDKFEPWTGGTDDQMAIRFDNLRDFQLALALNQTYKQFLKTDENVLQPSTGNQIFDAINTVFKKSGLWNFRKNQDIHPLAAMASLGKSLLTNTVVAFGGSLIARLIGQKSGVVGEAGMIASSMMLTVFYMTAAAGILLYYVVPLLPFIYFMFALMGWIRTVFEAMVGVPLWALAHLRYDGGGFPTAQSMFGYYILIDIFIRPILIIFGLVASSVIFFALAKTIGGMFDIVVSNLSGFDQTNMNSYPANSPGNPAFQRSPIDELIYTVIYAIVIYMIGMSCFKMIDLFPNSILRWMNAYAQGFGSRYQEDPGSTVSHHLKSGVSTIGSSAGSMLDRNHEGGPI